MEKKVLFVITKANWGGAQRYVFDLATSLSAARFDVSVAFGRRGALADALEKNKIPTHDIRALQRDVSIVADIRSFFELRALFRNERPDIAHLNSSKAGGIGALAARVARVPRIVFTVHGVPWQEDRNPFSRGLIFLSSYATFLLSNAVIAVSSDAYRQIARMPGCRSKVRLIHNGLAPLQFLPAAEARTLLPPSTGDGPVIGSVGELTWNKSYHTLLRAASILKQRGTEFFLYIVGDGEERVFLETLIEEEGLTQHVALAGFVPEAYRLLKAFDIFVLPSVKEGLPYVLLEAGQAGRAVAASAVGGVPDIVGDGVSGLLTRPKHPTQLADALQELLKAPALRERFGEALRERVLKEFSLANMAEETAALYTAET